ncbi:MAG: hypothetical protein IKW32_06755 [Bacteroidaceae bacterium]|nr:hypothetical protein [Bacteroidaceae bacterium]
MRKMILFAVAFIAVFAATIKMYGDSVVPAPNYYCVYFESVGRCYPGDKTPCYGVDGDCNWLDDGDQDQPNP